MKNIAMQAESFSMVNAFPARPAALFDYDGHE